MTASLLPANASAFERSLEAAQARLGDVPAPLDTIRRPLVVREEFLPFIGWGRSVDVWSRDWPAARRRAVVDASIRLHLIKGTEACVRAYVRHADGEVVSVTVPPMTVFSGPSPTKAEREAWLASLPQVRVWLIREEGRFGSAKAFSGGASRRRFFDRSYPVPSTALVRLRRRARWIVSGLETDVRVTSSGSIFHLHLPAAAGPRVFCNTAAAPRFFVPSDAWRRLVKVAPSARLPWRSPVGPSLVAVTSEPERVKEAGSRRRSVFCGSPSRSGYYVPSTARYRIYDRYPVHDGRRALRRAAYRFTGTGRYGVPAHTARLRLSIPGVRSRLAAGEGILAPRLRFWIPHDHNRVETVRRAIQSAKRLSDRIFMDIGPKPRFVAGQPFFADLDSLVVGQP